MVGARLIPLDWLKCTIVVRARGQVGAKFAGSGRQLLLECCNQRSDARVISGLLIKCLFIFQRGGISQSAIAV